MCDDILVKLKVVNVIVFVMLFSEDEWVIMDESDLDEFCGFEDDDFKFDVDFEGFCGLEDDDFGDGDEDDVLLSVVFFILVVVDGE